MQPPLDRKSSTRPRSLAWLILATTLMFAVMLTQQSHAQEWDGATSGQLYLATGQRQYQRAAHLSTEVSMEIKGLSAAVTLRQSFTNKSDQWLQGVYVFPLPEKSAVHAMRMMVGERVIQGQVRERQEASRLYTEARRAGKKSALVEQERPNLFTQSIANIAPGETVTVELGYMQMVRYDQGAFSLRFPMTMTPRYIPGQPIEPESVFEDFEPEQSLRTGTFGWAQPTGQVPDAQRITPRYLPEATGGTTEPEADRSSGDTPEPANAVTLEIRLDAGFPLAGVTSDSHRLQVEAPNGQTRHIRLADTATLDRDFELRWRPQDSAGARAAVFHEEHRGENFLQLMLVPPHARSPSPLPRELILIIDTSGSMQGPSIEQARASLLWALDQLRPEDTFNIIAFASAHRMLFRSSAVADGHRLAEAKQFVRGLRAGGGTEIAPALRAALRDAGISKDGQVQRLKQVVFITDGSVGNEAALFKLIDDHLGSTRLFTVGIGAAPNSYFMRKAAEFGRGSFTHIGDARQVAERMATLFSKLSHPVMAGVEVHWPTAKAVEMFPAAVPDLYKGEPLLVTARLEQAPQPGDEISVFGSTGNRAWRRHIAIPAAEVTDGADGAMPLVAKQWAREKVGALLDEKVQGADPEAVRRRVLAVALPFQLMSPYTSFVAVEEQVSRPANARLDERPLRNQLPAGQSAAPMMYPQTATSASFHLLTGLLALGLLWVVRRGLRYA